MDSPPEIIQPQTVRRVMVCDSLTSTLTITSDGIRVVMSKDYVLSVLNITQKEWDKVIESAYDPEFKLYRFATYFSDATYERVFSSKDVISTKKTIMC